MPRKPFPFLLLLFECLDEFLLGLLGGRELVADQTRRSDVKTVTQLGALLVVILTLERHVTHPFFVSPVGCVLVEDIPPECVVLLPLLLLALVNSRRSLHEILLALAWHVDWPQFIPIRSLVSLPVGLPTLPLALPAGITLARGKLTLLLVQDFSVVEFPALVHLHLELKKAPAALVVEGLLAGLCTRHAAPGHVRVILILMLVGVLIDGRQHSPTAALVRGGH
mmetsp:Transcript_48716/g.121977  ORF Transcript_48716/g.121977 Transcript_48716/m.121977 type:complete len:224 (-) Transcript_48716:802-1473(-)